jgi:cytosine/adenosine deaminase-related metal-dependent hydrolase
MHDEALLIRGGTVLTGDPELGVLLDTDILVEQGRIRSVGRGIEAGHCRVVDASDMIVMPGLVDSHRHTWQSLIRGIAADWTLAQYWQGIRAMFGPLYEPDDVYLANLLGALEALDAGVTTLVDWSHIMNSPAHADAAIQGLRDSGMRAVFAHGTPTDGRTTDWYVASSIRHPDDIRRIRSEHFPHDDGLVTLAMAARGPQNCVLDATEHDWNLARELGLRITVHTGSGRWGKVRPIEQLHSRGLLGPDTTYVHCNSLSDDELKLIADTGGTVSISPEVEMHMGHGYPATGRLLAQGVRPSLSVDVVTGVGGDLFGTMRVCLAAERARANDEALRHDTQLDELELRSADVLGFATIEGARACGLEAKTGSLTPGKEADLVLLRCDRPNLVPLNNPAATAVLAATPANVDTVLVAGRIAKQGGVLVGVDIDRVRRAAETARDRLFRKLDVPVGLEWYPNVADTWKP